MIYFICCAQTGFTTVHCSGVSESSLSSWVADTVPRWIQWPVVSFRGGVWWCRLDWHYEVLSTGLQLITGCRFSTVVK